MNLQTLDLLSSYQQHPWQKLQDTQAAQDKAQLIQAKASLAADLEGAILYDKIPLTKFKEIQMNYDPITGKKIIPPKLSSRQIYVTACANGYTVAIAGAEMVAKTQAEVLKIIQADMKANLR